MSLLQGTKRTDLDINDIRSWVVAKTLADEAAPYGVALMIESVMRQVAHDMDRHVKDYEIMYHDFDHTGPLSWWIEVGWTILCDECEYVAWDQDLIDLDLCKVHFNNALEQEKADLENDDIALGMRP